MEFRSLNSVEQTSKLNTEFKPPVITCHWKQIHITDNIHNRHSQRWCTFFKKTVYFLAYRKPIFAQISDCGILQKNDRAHHLLQWSHLLLFSDNFLLFSNNLLFPYWFPDSCLSQLPAQITSQHVTLCSSSKFWPPDFIMLSVTFLWY